MGFSCSKETVLRKLELGSVQSQQALYSGCLLCPRPISGVSKEWVHGGQSEGVNDLGVKWV